MNRTRRPAPTSISVAAIVSALLAIAAANTAAQTTETFAAGGHRETSPFKDVPPLYPECAGLVEQFDTMTDQLYALSDERRVSHSPRTDEIDREMLALENVRGGVGQQIRDCRQASIEAKERARVARLQGKVEETAPLQGGVEQTVQRTPPSGAGTPPLLPRKPELDTTPSASGSGGGSRQTRTDTSGDVRTPSDGSTTGTGGGSRTVTTGTSARIISRSSPGDGGADNGGTGAGHAEVELDVRAVLRSANEVPDAPEGGTVSNDFTRSYFFARGVRDGLAKAAEEMGGNGGRVMIAGYFILTGHPRKARDLLGLKPDSYVTIESLTKKVVEFLDAMTPKKDVGSVQQSYNVGVQVGKNLGGFLLDKSTGKIDGLDVPEVFKVPDLMDSVPNKNNPPVPGEKPR